MKKPLDFFDNSILRPPRYCDYQGCGAVAHYPAPKSRQKNNNRLSQHQSACDLDISTNPAQPHWQEHYHWFCKTHVKIYNQDWDWYENMSADEILADQLADLTWRRPTFLWHANGNNSNNRGELALDDRLDLFSQLHSSDQKNFSGNPPGNPFGNGSDNSVEKKITLGLEQLRRKNNKHSATAGNNGQDQAQQEFFAMPEKQMIALRYLGLALPISYDAVQKRYRMLAKKLHPDAARLNYTTGHAVAAWEISDDRFERANKKPKPSGYLTARSNNPQQEKILTEQFQRVNAAYQELKIWFKQQLTG